MARDGSGNYSIPNTFVPSTTIASTAVNANFSDIATALTGSLARNSEGPMTAAIVLHQNGFNYEVDPDTGIKRSAANEMAMFAGGANVVVVGTATVSIAIALNVVGAFAALGASSFGGKQTITGSAAGFVGVEIVCTDPGANGAVMSLYHNSISPAAVDGIGSYEYNANDSGANKTLYARTFVQITDPTNGSEDADFFIQAVIGGVLTNILRSSAAQIQIPGSLAVAGNVSGADYSGANATFTAALSGATAAGAMLASQAEQETGTATNKLVAPGTQIFHPTHPKAFAKWNGSTSTINASFGVSSITDNGTGNFTLNWSTAFSSANYWPSGMCQKNGGNAGLFVTIDGSVAPTAAALRIVLLDEVPNSQDGVYAAVGAAGDQ